MMALSIFKQGIQNEIDLLETVKLKHAREIEELKKR
jgi:hypothetical protein